MKLLRRRVLDMVVKAAYWAAVRECLSALFGVPDATAARLCQYRRAGVDLAPAHLRSDIFYHREPFDVAADLAATLPRSTWHSTQPDIDEPAVRSAYEWILAQHGLF